MMTHSLFDQLLNVTLERIGSRARFPESTYRLQFHAGFTFDDARRIIPYLRDLGITHVYASPILKATRGSTHGYDVIDHDVINPELGGAEAFLAFSESLKNHGLELILDTVPNHMGVGTNENAWWNDVLEKGRQSPFAQWFDIAWEGSPRPELHGKVLLPILGEPYGDVLEKGQLQLIHDSAGLAVQYYQRRLPVSPGADSREFIIENLAHFNGTPGQPRSFDPLDDLLMRQAYRLCYWRVAPDEINYRRFFDINDLAALCMERADVFEAAHRFTFELVKQGRVAGLRIDHPDGIRDPQEYFSRLQRHAILDAAREVHESEAQFHSLDWAEFERELTRRISAGDLPTSRGPTAWPLYVVAEKILALDEPLPTHWAVHGTSGYDFINQVNGLFVDPSGAVTMTQRYHEWIGSAESFAEMAIEKKRLMLDISFASELRMLANQFDGLARQNRCWRDFTLSGIRHALREVIALFPVYRSYISERGVAEADTRYIESAIQSATERNPATDASIFSFIRDVLLLHYPESFDEGKRAAQRRVVGRFQQVTSPVTAKGVEDTAFYCYNRFVSVNEVGGDPDHFGASADSLHRWMIYRQANWPHALSPLSTHDTKRSEEVRARLNVLSEMPEEWWQRVARWSRLNEPLRRGIDGKLAPDPNDEYLLYQTLVGCWPLEDSPAAHQAFISRIKAYMLKAMREGKVHTSWTNPHSAYESAVADFIGDILGDEKSGMFLRDIRGFQRLVGHYGLLNSLSQTLLTLTAPGVPDTYQGTELWDFSLVDPDNRRPVHYEDRAAMLQEISRQQNDGGHFPPSLLREMLHSMEDGRVKLLVKRVGLRCERSIPACSQPATISRWRRRGRGRTTFSVSCGNKKTGGRLSACRDFGPDSVRSRNFHWESKPGKRPC